MGSTAYFLEIHFSDEENVPKFKENMSITCTLSTFWSKLKQRLISISDHLGFGRSLTGGSAVVTLSQNEVIFIPTGLVQANHSQFLKRRHFDLCFFL